MKKFIGIALMLCTMSLHSWGQYVFTAANHEPTDEFDNIWSKRIYSDSLSTSTLIWVKREVRLHKHELHTEHVYVIGGSGDMIIGDESVSIVGGDILYIPKNTPHSLVVTSRTPVKILSVQSPEFSGKDRVFID